ncbi:hypothetical protein [Flavobacterium sangjuense]|uniref:Group-specific protein n=1 Tax=Flavobacterium sangjuense TaxID=2518177 RepID=A0A4V1CBT0_9FLAO|nr:hypothetical protein [Flavobacterium sangjuense]QBZ97054.1 hypothetical protein GS03_00539 [Flavobacterium sangjuense]
MNERWKYQLKTGGLWGVLMIVFSILFTLKEKPLEVQLTSPNFYIRSLVYLLAGTFILGYFNWKAKKKAEENKK